MLISEGYDPKQAAAIAYEKAGRKPKSNAQELTFEYLKAFYDHVMEHPAIFKELTDEIHIKARAKAGGKLHTKRMGEEYEEEETETKTMPKLNLHFNNAEFGGKVIYKDDQITIVPTAIMQERVTNGAMKLYDEFKDSVHWWKNKPIIPPHAQGDPPVNHTTKIAGKVLDAWLNPELKRIDGVAMFYNARIAPDDLKRMWEGEKFGNSPGYYCNDEALPGTWEGTEYKKTERGPYYPDHLSMVPRGACPLPHCGFNVEVPVDESKIASLLSGLKLNFEVIEMPEDETKKAEAEALLKANAAKEAEEAKEALLKANAPINEDKITGYFSAFELKMNAKFDALEKTLASKDEEIKTLKAAEELRQNEAKAQADAAAKAGFAAILNANAKMDIDKLYPEYVKSPALWIVTNTKLLDVKGIENGTIVPAGAAFVPHVNASEDEELKGLMPTDEQAGMRKVA